jgi:hypothetical protein
MASLKKNSLYNTKINKYLELSVAMRNLWCLEKISILPLIISATGIVPQSLFKNLKILDLGNTFVVEIQKGILLYSCPVSGRNSNTPLTYKHDSAGSFSITGNQLNRVYVRARDYAKLYWSTCPVLFRPDTAHVTS